MAEVVYVLTNEAMPGLVKIGRTKQEDANARIADLYTTGVPVPFTLEYACKVPNSKEVEAALHTAFAPHRINPKREFFKIDPEQAIAILRLLHTEDATPEVQQQPAGLDQESLAAREKLKTRRPNLNFHDMGIPTGSTLQSIHEDTTVAVASAKTVRLGDEEMSLTAATRKVLGVSYSVAPNPHWTFKGRLLSDIYDETYGQADLSAPLDLKPVEAPPPTLEGQSPGDGSATTIDSDRELYERVPVERALTDDEWERFRDLTDEQVAALDDATKTKLFSTQKWHAQRRYDAEWSTQGMQIGDKSFDEVVKELGLADEEGGESPSTKEQRGMSNEVAPRTSTTDYAPALAAAIEAAKEAGALLREEFHRSGGPRGSGGDAEIDKLAEQRIRERLLAACSWGYRGEETRPQPGDGHHLWLVDPNDGTSAYLKGYRGSAVSIAALRDGLPVLGVVYAFCYPDSGEGDLIAWAEGCPFTRNGREVTPPPLARATLDAPGGPPAVVFVSQDADRNPEANSACVRPARYIALPSIAYRLARVAGGDGVAAVSLNGPGDWDYAAGHALLRASGGVLVDERGAEVTYAPTGHSSTRYCFGGGPAAVRELCRRNWQEVFAAAPAGSPPFCLVRPAPGRAVADAGRLSRAQGCLLGQLAGDSLGGLVEFRDEQAIRREHPHGVRDLRDGGTWHNLAGQPTDDSELALMLARTLVHEGRYDAGRALDAYVYWWPHAWDRGGTLTQALDPASRGKGTAERLRLAQERASQTSQSNGCLMRISPLGIFGAGRPAEAAAWAREDSRLTHPHPVCQGACAAFVAAVTVAIAEGGSPQSCYEAALAEISRSQGDADVRKALESARHAPPADYSTQMGWVLIALQNAFWQLLHAPSLEEGVVDTVMRGGDTDTNAAIAGALLGAVHGRPAVPSRWVHALLSCRPLRESPTKHPQPVAFWPVDALGLAEALLTAGSTPTSAAL